MQGQLVNPIRTSLSHSGGASLPSQGSGLPSVPIQNAGVMLPNGQIALVRKLAFPHSRLPCHEHLSEAAALPQPADVRHKSLRQGIFQTHYESPLRR